MTNFKDKNRWETIKQYLNRKSTEEYEKKKNNITLIGILILMAGVFVGILK